MSNFPATLSQHRDPRLLWPLLGAASVAVHVLLLAAVGLSRLKITPVETAVGRPMPVQLVDERGVDAAASAPAAPQPVDLPQSVPNWQDALPAENTAFTDATGTDFAAESTDSPAEPAPSDLATGSFDSSLATEAETASGSAPAAPPAPAGLAPPGNSSGSQIVFSGLRLDPSGRDLPDTPPRMGQSQSLVLQPLLSSCSPGALSSPAAEAAVTLRITVEASGQISQAVVVQSSGDPAVDQLTACLVQQGLQLEPATTAGVGRPTDAVLLETRLQL